MALPNFENEEWKYTDVYDRSVLHGPVAFPKLRKLWKLGRIGPGTTVSNGTWLPRPVPVKRVKGLMTALSKKGDPGGVAPRGVSANTDDVDWAATGSGIEEQLWYCQMPNREVVGPLKTRTLQRLWLRGKVEGTYLVRAKSSSTWPSDRTYTVEGLMQALKVFHTNPVHGIDAGMGTPPPQVPSSLASSVRRKGHGAGMAVQSSPISAIQEEGGRKGGRPQEPVPMAAAPPPEASVSTTVEPESSSSMTSSTSPSSVTGTSVTSLSEATSTSTSLVVAAQSGRRGGRKWRPMGGTATPRIEEEDLGMASDLEEARARIKRLAHSLAQSEKEKIQAREVALSLRTMLVEERKQHNTTKQIASALPKSPLVENAAPQHSMELKKLSTMSTDTLFSYANTLRAENDKLLSIRKESVDAHKTRREGESGGGGGGATATTTGGHGRHETRSITPVPFNMTPSIPVSAGREALAASRASASTMPPVPREAYESSTRSVHAETLAGPASSPFAAAGRAGISRTMQDFYSMEGSRHSSRRNSDSGPCECTKSPILGGGSQVLDDIEREIDLFLMPRENVHRGHQHKDLLPPKRPQPSVYEAPPREEKPKRFESVTFSFPDSSEPSGVSETARAPSSSDPQSILEALQDKVEALSLSVEKSKIQSQTLQKSMKEINEIDQAQAQEREWSKETTTAAPRHQPRSVKVDQEAERIVRKFREDGFHLPLTYVEGFGYSLGGKKVHLAIFGKKLNIRFGGGYIDFMEYLSQKKIPLRELGKPKDEETPCNQQ